MSRLPIFVEPVRPFAKTLQHFLIVAAGADPHLLSKRGCPESERIKYESYGAAMLLFGILALFSGFLVFQLLFFPGNYEFDWSQSPVRWVICLAFAWLWTLIIFNLQRFVFTGAGHVSDHTRATQTLAQSLPSMLLSISIAGVIAMPLQTYLLSSEIETTLLAKAHLEQLQRSGRADPGSLAIIERDYQRLAGLALTVAALPPLPPSASNPSAEPVFSISRLKSSLEECHAGIHFEFTSAENVELAAHCRMALNREIEKLETAAAASLSGDEQVYSLRDELERSRAKMELRFARDIAETLPKEAAKLGPAGAIKKIVAAYETSPVLCWSVYAAIVLIQLMPILLRIATPRGVYDFLVEADNRERLASSGIEPRALRVFDRQGRPLHIDLYHQAENAQQRHRHKIQARVKLGQENLLIAFQARWRAIGQTASK